MRLLSSNRLALMTPLGLTACSTTMTAANRTDSADDRLADQRAESELREYHRHQHRGGVMQFVAMALDTLGPSDASRPQAEQVQRDLYACMAPAGEIQRTLRLTVAEGVAAGAVDLAKVDAVIGQLDGASAEVHGCSLAALNQLHAILSPGERAELVEKVQAHWAVWSQVSEEKETAGRGPGGRLAALTAELSLTPDQVERASAALHTALSGRAGFDRERVDADVQAFSAAFVAESFDARAAPMRENGRLASFGATRMAIFYETVTPLLTTSQRAELAGHLRERAGQSPAVSTN